MLVILVSVAVCAAILWFINQQFKATEPSLLDLIPPTEGGLAGQPSDPIAPIETQITPSAIQLEEEPKKTRKTAVKKTPKKEAIKASTKVKKPRTRKPKA